jgi:hypothetical protein
MMKMGIAEECRYELFALNCSPSTNDRSAGRTAG